jgi:hypothetical protein
MVMLLVDTIPLMAMPSLNLVLVLPSFINLNEVAP